MPEVIALFRQVLDAPGNAHAVAADRDRSGLGRRGSTDQAAVIAPDGLVAFLVQDAFVALLNRLAAHSTAVSRRGGHVLRYRFAQG